MLKQRVITALILAPLVVWGILALPPRPFELALGAVILLAGWEWSRLAGLLAPWQRGLYGLLLLPGLILITRYQELAIVQTWLPGLLVLWWFLTLLQLLRYRQRPVESAIRRPATLLAGWLVLAGTYLALLRLRVEFGAVSILVLMLLIWGADTAAYFAGRRWGRHKLLPNVSPGKSWEGVYGALLASLLLAVAGFGFLPLAPAMLWLFMALALVTVIFSIVGDLNESLYKRRAGLKDSSHLLPGHGGILDRIDSLTAAAPVFYVGLQVMHA